jgi:2-dehydro-3-deoxygalactonokinase
MPPAREGAHVTSDDATALIGLDWGTTSLRAYRIARDGRVMERRERDAGILRVADGGFAGALAGAVGGWPLDGRVPILAAGMIGSRQGWREVPYVGCPAGLAELAAGLGTVAMPDGSPVHLVPGLLLEGPAGDFPDVMRGEETQILGDLAGGRDADACCYLLPGTHSKWAWCERAGRIARFATYMTGEVYEVLTRHSILGRLMSSGAAPDAADAFGRGLAQAARSAAGSPGRLLHDLFGARTLGLTGGLPPEGLASYLSGLLIGAEVAAVTAGDGVGTVVILGSGTLAPLYARAAGAAGLDAVVGEVDAVARGLHAIARAAGLIRGTDDA